MSAPVGAVLATSSKAIGAARAYRKVLGGTQRQAGIMAAAGLEALQTMSARLTDDHAQARALSDGLNAIGAPLAASTPDHAPTRFDMIEPLAHRVHALGWHLQLHWTAAQIAEHRALLDRLPTAFVFDHFARLPMADALTHPACALVTQWLQSGRA